MANDRVYPRACGGTTHPRLPRQVFEVYPAPAGEPTALKDFCPCDGSIPRLRGNRWSSSFTGAGHRSIPAPAGNLVPAVIPHRGTPVYPAPAGEPAGCSMCTEPAWVYPAPAGEPNPAGCEGSGPGVYPRACGGTPYRGDSQSNRPGLSPRLRGNLVRQSYRTGGLRSIPGACGGTGSASEKRMNRVGLSPRLRGTRLR